MLNRLFLGFFVMTAEYLCASAGLMWDCADVHVLHFPCVGKTAYAAFNKEKGKAEDLYEGLREQILAGYRLCDGVVPKDLCSEIFFQPGVYECLAVRTPFLSTELQKIFLEMSQVLSTGKHSVCAKNTDWKDMQAQDVVGCVYPQGYTREWSCVDAQNVLQSLPDGRVCVVLKGADLALEGRLCLQKTCGDIKPHVHSLLRLKRALKQRAPSPQRSLRATSAVENFFALCKNQKHDIAFIFYPQKDKTIACFQGQRIWVHPLLRSDGVERAVSMSMTQFVQKNFLQGFALKYSERKTVDTDLLMTPQVRKVACFHRAFESEMLQGGFQFLKKYVRGASPGHSLLRSLDPNCQKWLWMVIEDEEFLHRLLDTKAPPAPIPAGVIFCLVRGETAVLQGVPWPFVSRLEETEDSLWVSWARSVLAQTESEN